jgi:hypothetical protein
MSTRTFSFLGIGVDVDDLAVEVGERAGCDLDGLAERELRLRLRGRAATSARGVEIRSTSACESGTGLRAGADEARSRRVCP